MTYEQLKDSVRLLDESRYKDNPEKRILANKDILSRIIKGTLPEFKDISLEEIKEEWLRGPIEISEENVTELKQEIIQKNNHKMIFDIHFMMRKKDEVIEVNLEIQDRYDPGYPLVRRGIVYCSAMLANQLGTVITHSHYERAHKAVTIWICLNPPKHLRNSIRSYQLEPRGIIPIRKRHHDLIQASFLYLGDGENEEVLDEEEKKALRLCESILSIKLGYEEKKRILEEEYDIKLSDDMKGDLEMTCDLRRYYYERGEESGIEKGISQGEENKTVQLLKKFVNVMNMSLKEAMELLDIPTDKYSKYEELMNL